MYVASPHAGYLKFLRAYPTATLYILGDEFVAENLSLVKHLPGNTPAESAVMIQALGILPDVRILSHETLPELRSFDSIIMPDEDVMHAWRRSYGEDLSIIHDDRWRLRWDWSASTKPSAPEQGTISYDELDRALIGEARKAAAKSPDWWRQVGAVLARDGVMVLSAFNRHVPHEQTAYLEGDPRSSFEPGERIDVSTALHGEVAIIAEAARCGIATSGCDLFVTTFPCPPCAAAVAASGIRRLYFADGYSLINGADALRANGIEIIRVIETPRS